MDHGPAAEQQYRQNSNQRETAYATRAAEGGPFRRSHRRNANRCCSTGSPGSRSMVY